MSSPSTADILGHYALHFSGRPRATRDPDLLAHLIDALHALPDGDLRRAEKEAHMSEWAKERQLISDEQTQLGDVGQALCWQVDQARMVWCRAHRALHSDAPMASEGLVAGLIDDVEQAQLRLKAGEQKGSGELKAMHSYVVADLDASAHALRALKIEQKKATQQAACEGLAVARLHIRRAQALLARFDELAAERPQMVVRPALLNQLHNDLQLQVKILRALKGGIFDSDEHRANCDALDEHAHAWAEESRAILLLRQTRTPDELAHALAADADDVLAEAMALPDDQQGIARGRWRILCDRMDELWRQLDGMSLIYGLSAHRQTEAGVTDCLAFLSRPWLE